MKPIDANRCRYKFRFCGERSAAQRRLHFIAWGAMLAARTTWACCYCRFFKGPDVKVEEAKHCLPESGKLSSQTRRPHCHACQGCLYRWNRRNGEYPAAMELQPYPIVSTASAANNHSPATHLASPLPLPPAPHASLMNTAMHPMSSLWHPHHPPLAPSSPYASTLFAQPQQPFPTMMAGSAIGQAVVAHPLMSHVNVPWSMAPWSMPLVNALPVASATSLTMPPTRLAPLPMAKAGVVADGGAAVEEEVTEETKAAKAVAGEVVDVEPGSAEVVDEFRWFAKTMCGQTLTMYTSSSVTVGEAMRCIADELRNRIVDGWPSTPVEPFGLVYAGRLLHDAKTLADVNVHPESTLHVLSERLVAAFKRREDAFKRREDGEEDGEQSEEGGGEEDGEQPEEGGGEETVDPETIDSVATVGAMNEVDEAPVAQPPTMP